MTADEPELTSELTVQPGAASSADDDLWLTYLNYDQSIQQAVRRLGALSSANVDEFRTLLLKGRERSKVKEYEAESIRRLQGEGFVGDEDLQRALIVLTAEDPRLGEELKRVVAAQGKPHELDQTIAAIRQQKNPPADQPRVNPAQVNPPSPPLQEPVRRPQPALAPIAPVETGPAPSWTKRAVIAAAIAAVIVAGLIWARPGLIPENTPKVASTETATVALRPSAPEETKPVPPPAEQQPPAPPAQAAAPAPTETQVQTETKAATSAAPDKAAADQQSPSNASPTATPTPGSYYKVVRGDMLSQIALTAYRDASKFRIIQRANPNLRYGPDRILVDQVIFVPPVS